MSARGYGHILRFGPQVAYMAAGGMANSMAAGFGLGGYAHHQSGSTGRYGKTTSICALRLFPVQPPLGA